MIEEDMKANIIINQRKKTSEIFLQAISSQYNFVDILVTFYPYDENSTADSFKILPYEEYVDEVSNKKRSAYRIIMPFIDKLFGIIMAVILSIVFLLIDPDLLLSVEAVVSLIGLYLVGKELWGDLDDLLLSISHKWKIKWKAQEYFYKRNYFGTIQSFWQYARNKKNQSSFLLAEMFDFISQSNSKTVELHFDDLKRFTDSRVKVLSIQHDGLHGMLGFKLSFAHTIFLGVTRRIEYFQSVNHNEIGTINSGKWREGSVLVKKTFVFGRIKFYSKVTVVTGNTIECNIINN